MLLGCRKYCVIARDKTDPLPWFREIHTSLKLTQTCVRLYCVVTIPLAKFLPVSPANQVLPTSKDIFYLLNLLHWWTVSMMHDPVMRCESPAHQEELASRGCRGEVSSPYCTTGRQRLHLQRGLGQWNEWWTRQNETVINSHWPTTGCLKGQGKPGKRKFVRETG